MTDDTTTTADAAAENVQLRAQLLDENRKLREALAANKADSLTAEGLTDEDVRRLESPLEFVVSNDELAARLGELESARGRVTAQHDAVQHDTAQRDASWGTEASHKSAPDTPSFTENGDGSWTRTGDGARGHFGPDGFTVG